MEHLNIINERNAMALLLPELDLAYFARCSFRVTGVLTGVFVGILYAGYSGPPLSLGGKRDVTIWEDSKVAGISIIFFGGVLGYAMADLASDYFFPQRV